MINMIILVVFALIGLVVGYLAISIKLSKAKEQAETTLLKAEQDAVNLVVRQSMMQIICV